jgi:DNA polymerase
MNILHVDLETRSTVDLRKCGVYVYAQHPDTDIIMAGWAMNDNPVLWTGVTPAARAVCDNLELFRAALHRADKIVAHNAGFERLLLNGVGHLRYGLPIQALERFDCTAARAAIQSLPRNLAGALSALGASAAKDMKGHALMMRMCKPRTTDPLTWWEDEDRIRRLADYMVKDVLGERELDKILAPMGDYRRAAWLQNERMNDRGVPVDLAFVNDARWLAWGAVDHLNAKMHEVTKGKVKKCSEVAKLKAWVKEQCGVEVDLGADEEGNIDLDKAAIAKLLADFTLPPDVRAALVLRQEAGKASIAKYQALLDRTNADWRARGNLVYHGASTGRFAGSGIQMQNMPRAVRADFDALADIMTDTPEPDEFLTRSQGVSPMTALQGMIRGAIKAREGRVLWWADYSSVEARGVAWLAGATSLLDLFASGGKVYEAMAANIYGCKVEEVTTDQRFIGKQVVLGCGYGMGWKKFMASCQAFGRTVDEETAIKAVGAYRDLDNAAVPKLWRAVEHSAMEAVRNPQVKWHAQVGNGPRLSFFCTPNKSWLKMRLPSGRIIYYCRPRIQLDDLGLEKLTYEGVNSYTKKWERESTWGGKLVENAVQAICADLMMESLQRLEREGFNPILSVHDEVICEPMRLFSEGREVGYLAEVISRKPSWAYGFPLAAEAKKALRYGK